VLIEANGRHVVSCFRREDVEHVTDFVAFGD